MTVQSEVKLPVEKKEKSIQDLIDNLNKTQSDPDSVVTQFKVARDLKLAQPETPNENIFFPVTMVKLSSLTGLEDSGQQAVIRRDTKRILAVHGSAYKLTKNEDVYRAVDDSILKIKELRTDGMKIIDRMSHEGGRTIRSYQFPDHSIQIGENDRTELQIHALNSYDGSTNLRLFAGGFRVVCANGMVIGDEGANFATRHTGKFDAQAMSQRLTWSVDNFAHNKSNWVKWAKTACTDKQALEVISRISDGAEKLTSFLYSSWLNEKGNMGANVWSLFNSITYWSTHYDIAEKNQKNEIAIIQTRERKVLKVLDMPVFAEVA